MAALYVTGNLKTFSGNNGHLAGALVVTAAVIAFAQVARPIRWLLLPIGAWLIMSVAVLVRITVMSAWNDCAIGVLIIACGLVRGRISCQFGQWDRLLE